MSEDRWFQRTQIKEVEFHYSLCYILQDEADEQRRDGNLYRAYRDYRQALKHKIYARMWANAADRDFVDWAVRWLGFSV